MSIPPFAYDPPPPYPGAFAFALPLYETATAVECWGDSYCLPPYQARTGRRFRPYKRILPVHRGYIPHQEKTFEEFYKSLQQSVNRRTGASSTVVEASSAAAPTLLRSQTPINNPAAAAPPPVVVGPPEAEDPEERRRRLIRRLFLLPDIIRIVRAGLGAALRAAEARFL